MIKNYFSLIKFSHTIFALPFALLAFFIASNEPTQDFSLHKLALIIICMITARSAAMAFNRYIDSDIDAKNERTAVREIPAGVLQKNSVLGFTIANSMLFVLATYFINPICFMLSPVALLVILGYSYTKRFTFLCHFILGIGLSLAPIGSYVAVTGHFSLITILLGAAVLFWVAGFDIIYAIQDEKFDKSQKLFSIPSFLGSKNALKVSRLLHLICGLIMCVAVYLLFKNYSQLSFLTLCGLAIFVAMLIYQQSLVKYNDLSKVNLAFFTANGIASVIFGFLLTLDFYI
jgi:4-hydroxybenzoate polyprenyltransferase